MDYLAFALLFLILFIIPLYHFKLKKDKRRLTKYMEKLPGPRALPFFGNVLHFTVPRNQMFKALDRTTQEYGPLFRIWLGSVADIHITRPEHAEIIMHSTEHIDKALGYVLLYPWLGTGLLTSTGNKWHSHRKMITPTFHFSILNVFFEVILENSVLLVEKLKKKCDQQPFDIYPYINLCALDIICETAMGVPIYAQKNEEMEYVKAVHEISELVHLRGLTPWLRNDFIFKWTNEGKRFYKSLNILHDFTRKVIQERKQLAKNEKNNQILEKEDVGKKNRLAFLDLLLQISEEGVTLTDEEIREEVDTFMFEGHDTTTSSINWILYLLGLYPECQKKVLEELNEIFGDSDRAITVKDLNEMKYLERVIKEGLRLFPSVPFIGRNLRKDVKIENYVLPKDANVIIHIYHIHRCPDQFSNPDKFNPDNFLPENVAKRHPYSFIPFSAGPRNCIGQKFALMEEKTILAQILRNFEIKAQEKLEDLNLMSELILRPEHGVILSLHNRTTKA